MPDDLTPRVARVVDVVRETSDVVTLRLRLDGRVAHRPGQFHQLALPAIGEAPISVSGRADGRDLDDHLDHHFVDHTIRAVGGVTRALCALSPGDELGLRGPYGRPWPLDALRGRPVVVIAGGIGLAPLRETLRELLASPADYPDVRLFYGARTPDDALYLDELRAGTRPGFTLRVTVDHAPPTWRGEIGVVTRLLRGDAVPEGAACLMCGPEVMMRFSIEALRAAGIPDERIWITMERHMKCAAGFCGRCQYGPYFVCKDGPVFRLDEVALLFGRDGF
ncbi:MAG: FAD/NAD(P)-binding protein [Myxococcales bacterium]|nr:FAD/NAD(P)-binding protein [Myxococcales bacterium]